MKIKVSVSAGEIIDKITILEIKAGKIKDGNKLVSVFKELNALNPSMKKIISLNSKNKNSILKLKKNLYTVNSRLWIIEDKLRNLESKKKFGKIFISLARSVYINNDKRAGLKNKINDITGSQLMEVKEYKNYK